MRRATILHGRKWIGGLYNKEDCGSLNLCMLLLSHHGGLSSALRITAKLAAFEELGAVPSGLLACVHALHLSPVRTWLDWPNTCASARRDACPPDVASSLCCTPGHGALCSSERVGNGHGCSSLETKDSVGASGRARSSHQGCSPSLARSQVLQSTARPHKLRHLKASPSSSSKERCRHDLERSPE